MAELGLDEELVRRIVRRLGAYMQGGDLDEGAIDQVFELFEVDDGHRPAVLRALASAGISVPSREDHESASKSRRGNGNLRGVVARPVRAGAKSRSAKIEIEAARKVLAEDRLNPRPWTRILTAEEEVGLARLMRECKSPLDEPLPKGFRATCSGDEECARAFDAMVLHNRGLVWSMVNSFVGQGLDPEDIEQSGYEGLRRAVEKYDGSAGWKFSTYATHWIRQAIQRALADQGRLIRIPVHLYERVQKVLAVRNKLLLSNGRVSHFAIAADLGLDVEQVREALLLSRGAVSLDAPVGDGGESSLLDFVDQENPDEPDLSYAIEEREFRDSVRDAMALLPEREEMVLKLRYGFLSDEPMTLEEVGSHFGFTRERARQLEAKAKKKLLPILSAAGFRAPG